MLSEASDLSKYVVELILKLNSFLTNSTSSIFTIYFESRQKDIRSVIICSDI